MDYQALLDDLRQLGEMKNNWYSLGKILASLKVASGGPPGAAQKIREAAGRCNVKPDTLNRAIMLREFFDKVKDSIPELSGTDPNSLPYSSVDILMRLHRVNREAAIEGLRQVANGQITFRRLRERYDKALLHNVQAAIPHQVATMGSRNFKLRALSHVQNNSRYFCGKPVYIQMNRSYPMPIDAIGYIRYSDEIYCGFEFLTFIGSEQQKIPKGWLTSLLVKACFFTRFWVVLASSMGEKRIDSLCNLFRVLEYNSVGIAVLPWPEDESATGDLELAIKLTPTGDPNPDWRDHREEFHKLSNAFYQAN